MKPWSAWFADNDATSMSSLMSASNRTRPCASLVAPSDQVSEKKKIPCFKDTNDALQFTTSEHTINSWNRPCDTHKKRATRSNQSNWRSMHLQRYLWINCAKVPPWYCRGKLRNSKLICPSSAQSLHTLLNSSSRVTRVWTVDMT